MPVIVEFGHAKYRSFISSVRVNGQAQAVLEPIAAESLPQASMPFRIVPLGGTTDWSVSAARIWRERPRRACVDLSQARVFDGESGQSAVAVHETDLLVLVVPAGLDDDEYVFPVQRVGADVCEIRCNAQLAPGVNFSCVELVGDRRLLRRAVAQVLEVVPWYMADGTRSFSCRLSLGEESGDAEAAYDSVTDPGEVRRLLQLAAAMRVSGWFEAPGFGDGALQVIEVGKDAASLALRASTRSKGRLPRSVRFGFPLLEMAYELDVRALELVGDELRTSLPLTLRRRRRHRRDQRVCVDPELNISLCFRNPVTGAIETERLNELSFFSACFEFDPARAVLWRGLPLEQAQIRWDQHRIQLGDLMVDQCASASGKNLCVASITHASIADDPAMIRLVASLQHPHVRTHDGGDFSALHETYLKAGLFGPHMHRNLDPIVEQTKLVWRKAHCDAADVVRTFVHGPNGAPDAAVTVMRAWEHAWVAQHFVDTSPELNSGTGKLQTAYLDHLVPRPDCRYLLFFVKSDNRIMNSYLRRFFATTGTPDAVTRSTVELWSRKMDQAVQARDRRGLRVRPCRPEEELVVGRAAQRCLGSQAAAALSMLPGELLLPDTATRFGKAGLTRDRRCDLVLRDDEPVYAILEERATPGLNLTWMLNACWIVPIHPERDRDGVAFDRALQAVVERPAQTATGDRFLNLPEGLDPEILARWGFTKEAAVYLYVLTRAGLHRFFHYATSRYGKLDALAARRERQRESREPPQSRAIANQNRSVKALVRRTG